VVVKPDSTPEKARETLWNELDKLKTDPISDVELEKAKNQILRQLFSSGSSISLQRSLGRAEQLAEYTSFYGNPAALDEDIKAYLKVTPADVQRVAKKIFTREGATVVDVEPKMGAEPKSVSFKH
jgi:zinc protease